MTRFVLAVVVFSVVLAACGGPAGAIPEPAGALSIASIPSRSARAALDRLPVRGRAAMTGYSREQFGPPWADVDRNHCDTRNDTLARDLKRVVKREGSKCIVVAGTLLSPYTGETVTFERGPRSTDIQVDHVVSLANAWATGAQQMSPSARLALANDPANLLAVEGKINQQKGSGDAATYLPPARTFRCRYVAIQVATKLRYQLWLTIAEKDAMVRVLNSCPEQQLP